jgi:hypothetical protein
MAMLLYACLISLVLSGCNLADNQLSPRSSAGQWTAEEANNWYEKQSWPVGCNFLPSTAINQLEMWQADTFDPDTIDRELGWAAQLGFNTMRVYLHDLPWQQDADGFLKRIDQYLTIADSHGIGTIFVIFDDCWDPSPQPGKQRAPKPHVHNSGWVQSPGKLLLAQPDKYDQFKPYVQGVLTRFKNDPRVLLWDLYNEPGNGNVSAYGKVELKDKPRYSIELLAKTFAWARQVNPSQPLTVCVWTGDYLSDPQKLSPLNRLALTQSDVISFHFYNSFDGIKAPVNALLAYHRPIVCTEYMSRPTGCTFQAFLPYFKQHRIGAINWGLVAGKSQTQYPWETWTKTYTAEPKIWFHDVFRPNGQPYNADEAAFIKKTINP